METRPREEIRQEPHDTDAEKSVLGSMLLEANAADLALEQLAPGDFYVPAHETVFATIGELRAHGQAIDMVTLVSRLRSMGQLERCGGVDYVAELIGFVPTAVNAQQYIRIVLEKSTLRQLVRAGTAIARNGMDEARNVEDSLNDAEKRIYEISMRKTEDSLQPISELVPAAYSYIGDLMSRKGKLTGIATGFTELDRMTNGLQNSDLIIIAGRPAMGKSSFAMNIAQYAALHDGRSVLVFSLEMSAPQLVMRMLCTEASVDSQRIKEGLVDDADLGRLMTVMDPMSKACMFIDDTGGVTVPDIRSRCRRLKARKGLDMVVIDYMQLIQGSGQRRSDNRQQEISDMTRQLKLLAKELDVPILLLAQLNRGPETRQDHTPMISDLRESGSIEQDADMVILLYRPAVYDETEDNMSQAIIAKHRHGPTGVVELVWQGEYTRFMNPAPQDLR